MREGKALGLKCVRFIPEPGTPGTGTEANTREDGTFSLLAIRPGALKAEEGAIPGSYLVTVTEPAVPLAAARPQMPPGIPEPAITPADLASLKGSLIPPGYTSPETTQLRAEVPRGGATIDLTLTSGR